jgi:hypothetical protein
MATGQESQLEEFSFSEAGTRHITTSSEIMISPKKNMDEIICFILKFWL